MNELDLLKENLEYNKKYLYSYVIAMKSAIDDFVDKRPWCEYLQIDYINEKFKECKYLQKRIYNIEKNIKKLTK